MNEYTLMLENENKRLSAENTRLINANNRIAELEAENNMRAALIHNINDNTSNWETSTYATFQLEIIHRITTPKENEN